MLEPRGDRGLRHGPAKLGHHDLFRHGRPIVHCHHGDTKTTAKTRGTSAPRATIVTSVPARLISATPSGTTNSSSGTGPLAPKMARGSKYSTGLSSRMAALSRPLASYGVDGSTTLRPPMFMNR